MAHGVIPGIVGPGSSAGWMNTTADRGIERGEQLVLALVADVDPGMVGQQHHPVGVQIVKGTDRFGDGLVDVRHRHGGEEAESVGLGGDDIRGVVVEVTRQRGGVGGVRKKTGSRRGHRQNGRGDVEFGHGLQ